jgi:hypothetical protein
MMSPANSTNIYKNNDNVKVIVIKNDTFLVIPLSDGRKILSDLLKYKITDSLLVACEYKDSINDDRIYLYKSKVDSLSKLITNKDIEITNLNKINNNNLVIDNKRVEENKALKREIRKQKLLKSIFFVGMIVIPLTITILLEN